jgi:hypothetical protein
MVSLAGILVLPESPPWLLAHDKNEEARHILWALEHNAKSIDPSDPLIDREMAEIQHAIYEEKAAAYETCPQITETILDTNSNFLSAGSGGKRALLKNGPQRFFHRTLLGIGGQFMQQLSGINLITYVSHIKFLEVILLTLSQYAPVIFEESVGLSHSLSLLISGFNGVAYFFSSLIPIWVIDR